MQVSEKLTHWHSINLTPNSSSRKKSKTIQKVQLLSKRSFYRKTSFEFLILLNLTHPNLWKSSYPSHPKVVTPVSLSSGFCCFYMVFLFWTKCGVLSLCARYNGFWLFFKANMCILKIAGKWYDFQAKLLLRFYFVLWSCRSISHVFRSNIWNRLVNRWRAESSLWICWQQ